MNQVAEPKSKYQPQYPDLPRLAKALQRAKGEFALFFAECNLPSLRNELANKLTNTLPCPPLRVDLSVMDWTTLHTQLDELISLQARDISPDAAIFLFGLERLLPTLSHEQLLATVQQLNWRRSSFARLQRPLVIWLPRYALNRLAEQTPDFYDWYSGVFVFPANQSVQQMEESTTLQSLRSNIGIHIREHSSPEEKKRWLSALKSLLDEHPQLDAIRARLLSEIGYLLKGLGDYKQAVEYYQQALNIQQQIGNKPGESAIFNNIAATAHACGDYDTSFDYLTKALTIQRQIGDKSGEGTTLNNIGETYRVRGDYASAINYLKKALIIRQEIGDKSGEGTTLNNIGEIYRLLGDYNTAFDHLKKALTIKQELGDKSGEGSVINNIGEIYRLRGDYDTAYDYLNKSLVIRQELGDKYGEGVTLNNMAITVHEYGDYDASFRYLKKALTIQQEIGDVMGFCTTTFNMGHIYWQNNEQKEALISWITTYQAAKKIGYMQALDALDNVAKQLGLPDGAQSWERLVQKMEAESEDSPHLP